MNLAERKKLFAGIDIYPVTCEAFSLGRSNLEVLAEVIAGGAKIIQLREKAYSDREFYLLAKEFRKNTAVKNVLLIINDRIDIALAVGADGVHLGQNDLPAAVARGLAPDLLIGVSTRTLAEAQKAEADGADYINAGPIFPTQTKSSEPVGVEAIKAIAPKINCPFTVMGGINLANIDAVLAAGAGKVAVVSALTKANDIAGMTRLLVDRIQSRPNRSR